MNLTKKLLHQIDDVSLTHAERARLYCQLAKQLEDLGNYEEARDAMGELWQRVGERPTLEGLDQSTAAEVLLRAGVLTGWIGSAQQIEGAQEAAKNLISESITIFEALHEEEKVAEAQTEIAYCYWREGAFNEARVMLQQALSRLVNTNGEVRVIALLRSALVEKSAKRFNDALRIHSEAAPIFEKCNSHVLRAKFHNEFANVLNYLSATEYREDYIDRALIEYTAASFHFEQAGHTSYQACVENNLGFLYSKIGRFNEAHDHLDRAEVLLTSLKDNVHLAQTADTRAQVLLAEGRVAEAEKIVQSAVRALERGGEQSLLAEALTTHGIALARLGQAQQSRLTLGRAVEVAQQAGDLESAGQAALTIIEELSAHLSAQDLGEIYERAADFLEKSENLSTLKRLGACARRVLYSVHATTAPPDWKGFSYRDAVRRFESYLIERALRDAGGVVTRAAQLLGFKHHQNLIFLLEGRHKHLLHARTPIVPRKRSIIRLRSPQHISRYRTPKAARPISILYVEDNKAVADVIQETLESEGWAVETCAKGSLAQEKLANAVNYDIILLDNEVPGVSGLELARYARTLPKHQHTPIIMLTASDCETEARLAGVNTFLRKPNDIAVLVETITRLLTEKPEQL